MPTQAYSLKNLKNINLCYGKNNTTKIPFKEQNFVQVNYNFEIGM